MDSIPSKYNQTSVLAIFRYAKLKSCRVAVRVDYLLAVDLGVVTTFLSWNQSWLLQQKVFLLDFVIFPLLKILDPPRFISPFLIKGGHGHHRSLLSIVLCYSLYFNEHIYITNIAAQVLQEQYLYQTSRCEFEREHPTQKYFLFSPYLFVGQYKRVKIPYRTIICSSKQFCKLLMMGNLTFLYGGGGLTVLGNVTLVQEVSLLVSSQRGCQNKRIKL